MGLRPFNRPKPIGRHLLKKGARIRIVNPVSTSGWMGTGIVMIDQLFLTEFVVFERDNDPANKGWRFPADIEDIARLS